MLNTTHRRRLAAVLTTVLVLASCGGGSDDATEATPDEVPATDATDSASESGEADEEATPDAEDPVDSGDSEGAGVDETDEAADATFEPGEVEYRAVNLLDEPVDLWVRTSGFVEAFPIQKSLQPGEVSDFVAPPADQGRFLVTVEGATDATCVIDCDDFISELTSYPEEGPARTVLLYPNDSGEPEGFEFWELPTADAFESGNSMVDADPATALAAISAVAIREPDFGYRVSTDIADVCLPDLDDSSFLIGGNQVIPYDFGQASEFTIHGFDDQDCTGEPVGGPFPFSGLPGDRFHVMLHGTPGALEALVLPMVDGLPDTSTAPDADPAARDEAVGLMGGEVAANFELDDASATCLAELIVDRIGPDILVVDGELVDLDGLGDDVTELAGAALVESIDTCGIDPSVFGG